MTDVNFNMADLSQLRYVMIVFSDSEGKPHEIRTEVKNINGANIMVYFKCTRQFRVSYPQSIIAKFVADDGLYTAETTLIKMDKSDTFVYLTIESPQKMDRQQNRKYYRVNLRRTSVLITTDKFEQHSIYMSRLVDVSAGGVLIHQLESMFDNDYISINPSDYKSFNLVLFLDLEIVLKLSARFVRHEKTERSDRYAFEFIKMKQCDIDTISKYVTKEQVEQLKVRNRL